MVPKLFLLLVTSLFLSSCSFSTNNNPIPPSQSEPSPASDTELLKSLESDTELNFDSEFKNLESDLQ